MNIILASGSPRRRELLGKITPDFTVQTAPVDERSIENRIEEELKGRPMTEVAEAMVQQLSRAKAFAVYEALGCPADTVIIGADTAVAVHDEIMGKPADREDAVRMLRKLSQEVQMVYTGVTLIKNGQANTFAEASPVYFYPLDEAQEARIQAYCDTDEPYDKAGAYGIQAIGFELVDHYEGEMDNIMGFPTTRVRAALENI